MHTHRAVLAVGLAIASVVAGCGGGAGIEQAKAHAIATRSGFKMHWMSYVGRLSNGHTTVRCVKIFRQSPLPGERRAVGAQIAVFEIACHTPLGRWHDAAGVPE